MIDKGTTDRGQGVILVSHLGEWAVAIGASSFWPSSAAAIREKLCSVLLQVEWLKWVPSGMNKFRGSRQYYRLRTIRCALEADFECRCRLLVVD
jgi:hypothetical protein